jgi:thioredoxin 1
MSKVFEINDGNFEDEVLRSPVPVLLEFFSEHCGPCRAQKSVLVEQAAAMGSTAKVATVNVAENERLTNAFKVNVVPTLIVFCGGKVAQRLVGFQNMNLLKEALEV